MTTWWARWGGPKITRNLILYGGGLEGFVKERRKSNLGGSLRRETCTVGMENRLFKKANASFGIRDSVFATVGQNSS